jgi:hypothetical protein
MSEEEIEEEGMGDSFRESAMFAWEWMMGETDESLSIVSNHHHQGRLLLHRLQRLSRRPDRQFV